VKVPLQLEVSWKRKRSIKEIYYYYYC